MRINAKGLDNFGAGTEKGSTFAKILEKVEKSGRKLPDKLEYDYVICDNSLNRKGWRMLVQGVELEEFEKNPVCCVEHDTWSMPVGKWKDVHVEGERLVGTLEFDRNDETAVKLYWKYADGYMSACSLHVRPLEESSAPEMLLPGQVYATLTKSELLEVSLVTLPGQAHAVRLSAMDGGDYQMHKITNKNDMDTKKEEMQEGAARLHEENETLKKQLAESRQLNAKNLVALHAQRGVVSAGEVEPLEQLAMTDYATTEKMLLARVAPSRETPQQEVKPDEGKQLAEQLRAYQQPGVGGDERAGWTYLDYYKKDRAALAQMEKETPERYAALCEAFEKESREKGLGI